MNSWQAIRVGMAGFAELIGALFLACALYFTYWYLTDTGNPQRHEYSFGIWLGLFYGFCGFLVAAFLAISVKRVISRKLFVLLSAPSLFTGLMWLGLYFYSVGADVLGN